MAILMKRYTSRCSLCTDQIDVITNFAVITKFVIMRVHCNWSSLSLESEVNDKALVQYVGPEITGLPRLLSTIHKSGADLFYKNRCVQILQQHLTHSNNLRAVNTRNTLFLPTTTHQYNFFSCWARSALILGLTRAVPRFSSDISWYPSSYSKL